MRKKGTMSTSDPEALVKARALRYLGGRDRSRREVELRLRRYGHDARLVSVVIAWLEELGYVDDQRFALAYAREKLRSGWGGRRIRAGLAAAGVPSVLIEKTLDAVAAEVVDGGGESVEDALVALVVRRFGRAWEQDPAGTARRASAFLQRRGHDWETVKRVLQVAFESDDEQGFC